MKRAIPLCIDVAGATCAWVIPSGARAVRYVSIVERGRDVMASEGVSLMPDFEPISGSDDRCKRLHLTTTLNVPRRLCASIATSSCLSQE
jgi:hypothetical protein